MSMPAMIIMAIVAAFGRGGLEDAREPPGFEPSRVMVAPAKPAGTDAPQPLQLVDTRHLVPLSDDEIAAVTAAVRAKKRHDFNEELTKEYEAAHATYRGAVESKAEQDYIAAHAALLDVARTGNPLAATYLGFMYEKGYGLTADPAKAAKLYEAPAAAGFGWAAYRLAKLYESGVGAAKDIEAALKLYRIADSGGIADAKTALKRLKKEPSKVLLPVSDADVAAITAAVQARPPHEIWIELNKEAEDAVEAFVAAYKSNADADWIAAHNLLRDIALKGNIWGAYYLGSIYALGQGVAADPAKAAKLYEAPVQHELGLAEFELGVLYESGSGVPQDIEVAVKLYRSAAQHGARDASVALVRLRR